MHRLGNHLPAAIGSVVAALLLAACASTPRATPSPPGAAPAAKGAAAATVASVATAGAPAPSRAPAAPVAPDPELLTLSGELSAALAGTGCDLSTTPAGLLLLRLPAQLLFEPDSTDATTGATQLLTRLTGVLVPHARLLAEVSVHTDVIGGMLANDTLARQRAEAVVTRLVAAGLDSPRLQVAAGGAKDPIAGNDTAEGRQRNRRVEILMRLAAVPAAS
jgi:outer membrane protein OmpA-like peptidoglycan-associated protein